MKSDRNELNRQLYEILYAEVFIKMQSKLAEPLEFLNMNTGFIQVKYHLLKQWPIITKEIASFEDKINVKIDVEVKKWEATEGAEVENI